MSYCRTMIKQNYSRVYMLVIYLIRFIDFVVFCVFDLANIHISVVLVENASISLARLPNSMNLYHHDVWESSPPSRQGGRSC